MPAAPFPADEAQRLEALQQLDLLNAPLGERFDRITRTLKRLFDVPITYIALIDQHQQLLQATYGTEARPYPREQAICAHTILQKEYLVCEDLSQDPRFADNPFVTGESHLRFYAGFSLRSPTRGVKALTRNSHPSG